MHWSRRDDMRNTFTGISKSKLGIHAVVTPVVAVPGWFIERTGKSDVWVINPKERNELRKELVVEKLGPGEAENCCTY